MIWKLIIFLVVLVVIVIVYAAFTYTEAVLEVKSQPREPMFECVKHGLIRKKHLVRILDPEQFPDHEICPHCFNEKIQVPLDESVIPQ